MSNDNQTLGKRAIACKHWQWFPGMEATNYYGELLFADSWAGPGGYELWPNFIAPQTCDLLLDLVKHAWEAPYAYFRVKAKGREDQEGLWLCDDRTIYGDSKVEACVLALEQCTKPVRRIVVVSDAEYAEVIATKLLSNIRNRNVQLAAETPTEDHATEQAALLGALTRALGAKESR